MTDTATATPKTAARCDANASGRAATDWGMDFLPCQARRALRSFTDSAGITRYFCPANGHRANAERRFGVSEATRVALAIERISADFDEEVEFDYEGSPEFNGSFR